MIIIADTNKLETQPVLSVLSVSITAQTQRLIKAYSDMKSENLRTTVRPDGSVRIGTVENILINFLKQNQ